MATKLTFKSETNYIDDRSDETSKVDMEFYTKNDKLKWHFEKFCLFLYANDFSLDLVQKYLNTDGCEVWEIGEE